jgi:hypothetical protein
LANAGRAEPGDPVLYPSELDSGRAPENVAGRLVELVELERGGAFVNRVDAALCSIEASRLGDLDFTIHGVKGTPRTIAARRGMKVVKRGRTTGTTHGHRVLDVNFRVVIHYDGLGEVGFLDQVLCERYSRPGDSGAIVCDEESGRIVGLHFAGASGGSVFNPIGQVRKALGFRFTSR